MLAFVRQNSDLIGDVLRGLQPVKSAEQWANVVKLHSLPTVVNVVGTPESQ